VSFLSIREFINRSYLTTAGIGAAAAALEARANGCPLDPALATRIGELLSALGVGNSLDEVSPEEAAALVAEIRCLVGSHMTLLDPGGAATSWSYSDPKLLTAHGDFARFHGRGVANGVIPALEGLAQRFESGGSFLDIGVGVAGLAISLAELVDNVRIVGIDVWQPSLRLARENVARAGLDDRIELREQGAESLTDEQAFDLAWMPLPFMPERVIPQAIENTFRALKPGGWLVLAYGNLEIPEPGAALGRFHMTIFGGPLWTVGHIQNLAHARGFADVHVVPGPPGPAVLIAARRPM
jgi:SAM-dependent methyltransferase